jgi:predicted CXXCH cytochrome family protein
MTISAQPSGVSLACLSCHDGQLAFDQLRNGPGPADFDPAAASRGWSFNVANSLSGQGIADLTQDLSDDHPVSVTYDNSTGSGDAAFNDIADAETAGIRFYGGSGDLVECGSCHNPHDDTNDTFLRFANTNSDVCTACHIK